MYGLVVGNVSSPYGLNATDFALNEKYEIKMKKNLSYYYFHLFTRETRPVEGGRESNLRSS